MPYYDHDKDYPFAAFITNLGKYNEGELVGEWVKFPTTAEELKEVFKRIGIGQKDDFGQPYEEWFITDYDCYVDGLYSKLGEYENLDELNYLSLSNNSGVGFSSQVSINRIFPIHSSLFGNRSYLSQTSFSSSYLLLVNTS